MKDKLIYFLKAKGHIIVAAVCLVLIAVVGIITINNDNQNTEPVISYSTPVSGNNHSEDSSSINSNNDSESTDVSKPIKDENNGDNEESTTPEKISISKPLSGEILTEFASKKLIYNATMQEWTTHAGIDIKGEPNCDIKAVADGKISAIKNDPKYGLCIIIDHSLNGRNFSSLYCGLGATAGHISEGILVKANETIGVLGEVIFCEKVLGPHLHFELIENNTPLNPAEYWK